MYLRAPVRPNVVAVLCRLLRVWENTRVLHAALLEVLVAAADPLLVRSLTYRGIYVRINSRDTYIRKSVNSRSRDPYNPVPNGLRCAQGVLPAMGNEASMRLSIAAATAQRRSKPSALLTCSSKDTLYSL